MDRNKLVIVGIIGLIAFIAFPKIFQSKGDRAYAACMKRQEATTQMLGREALGGAFLKSMSEAACARVKSICDSNAAMCDLMSQNGDY